MFLWSRQFYHPGDSSLFALICENMGPFTDYRGNTETSPSISPCMLLSLEEGHSKSQVLLHGACDAVPKWLRLFEKLPVV